MKDNTYKHPHILLENMNNYFFTYKLELEGQNKEFQGNINGSEENFNKKLDERFENFENK